VHIDAIAHVNKARGLFDNFTPGLQQLGSIWLPLPHILMAPLASLDFLWSNGLAGSLVSAACYIGTACLLFSTGYAWTGSRLTAWMAFLLFALNPRLIYLFTTPMTEPLMILCLAGLLFYMLRWVQTADWRPFSMACLMVFAGTLTRYEAWAVAAAGIVAIPVLAPKQRAASTVLFAGAAAAGPMLWMLFNMAYFDDPLMFAYGRGSAQDYAQEYFFRTGKTFATAGDWSDSFATYFVNVAYCLNPAIVWLALGGVAVSMTQFHRYWKPLLILAIGGFVPYGFYVYNLYANIIPILMPGLGAVESQSIYNVRYGTIMAASLPLLAAFFLSYVLTQTERRPAFSFWILILFFLPDPIPPASTESANEQFTENLFYREGIHNQSFWMPPFVEIGKALKSELNREKDSAGFILTNGRVIHPVVWATAIPMRRFIHEMNRERWNKNIGQIDPEIEWVITEEGDQLWHAQGKFLQANFIEVASAKTPSTGTVHLYRRPAVR
jgi:hypothetical protein